MPDFVRKLEPQYFTEAIALACDVDECVAGVELQVAGCRLQAARLLCWS